MASNQTIEKFDIEMLLNSTNFTKKLQQLETKVMQASKRMERNFENSFNLRNRGAAKMQVEFNRVILASARAGRMINQNLQFNGANQAVNQWGANIERQAARAREAIGRANRGLTARMGGNSAGGAPRTNSRGLTQEQRRAMAFERATNRAADRIHAQQYGDVMSRLQRGGYRQNASQFRQEMFGHYQSFRQSGDMAQFQRGMRETIRTQRNFLAQQVASTKGVSTAADGLIGKLGSLGATVLTLQRAMEYFQQSLDVGIQRAQSRTMLSTAFGKNGTTEIVKAAVDEVANKFGMDKGEAESQASILRMTLPQNVVQDQDIAKLLQTEAVFSHATGMTTQQQYGMNYLFGQEGAADKAAQGNNWRQLVDNMPAVIQPLLEITGKKNIGDLREYAKTLSGAEWVKLIIQAMEKLNNEGHATEKAMDNVQAAIGRYNTAVKDGQEEFFNGYSDGFKEMLSSFVELLGASGSELNGLGEGLGYIFERFAAIANTLADLTDHTHAYFMDVSDWVDGIYDKLPDFMKSDKQKGAKETGSPANTLVDDALAYVGIKSGLRLAGKGGGLIARVLGIGSGAAGAAGGGGMFATGSLFRSASIFNPLTAPVTAVVAAKQMSKHLTDEQRKNLLVMSSTVPGGHAAQLEDPNYNYNKILNPNGNGKGGQTHILSDLADGLALHFRNFMGKPDPTIPMSLRSPNYQPNVPLSVPKPQEFKGQMDINIKLNDQDVAKISKSVVENFHESRNVSAALMRAPWGEHAALAVPFPVQKESK